MDGPAQRIDPARPVIQGESRPDGHFSNTNGRYRCVGAVEPIISQPHSERQLFTFEVPGEQPLPILSTGGYGHKVRIRKNEKQTFTPSFRVSTWGGRCGP